MDLNDPAPTSVDFVLKLAEPLLNVFIVSLGFMAVASRVFESFLHLFFLNLILLMSSKCALMAFEIIARNEEYTATVIKLHVCLFHILAITLFRFQINLMISFFGRIVWPGEFTHSQET